MGHAIDLHGSGQDPGPRGWDGIVAGMDGLRCVSNAECLSGVCSAIPGGSAQGPCKSLRPGSTVAPVVEPLVWRRCHVQGLILMMT